MKNKLLFSTALVAASLSFATVANAEIFINNQTALDNLEDETSGVISFDNLAESTDLGTLTLNSDKQVNGQVTLHDRVTLLNGKEDDTANFHVTGWLTETAPGSDTSDIRIGVGNGGLVLGNNLKTRSVDLRDNTDIVLYYSEAEAEGLGQYAINPEKTLETIGHRRIENGTTHVRASRDGEGQDEDKDLETKTSLVLNGTGSVVIEGDATLQVDRKTTFNIDVIGDPDEEDNEGTGNLIANADVVNNATIANDVTINADKSFENKGTLSGAVTNNGTLTSALAGLTGSVDNKAGAFLNINGGGTLNNGVITNAGMVKFDGDYTLADGLNLAGASDFRNNVTLAGDVTVAGGAVDGTLDLQDNVWNGDVFLDDGAALAFNFGSNAKIEGDVDVYGAVDLKATIASGTEDGEHQFANSVTINDAMAFDDEGNPVLDEESNPVVATEGKLNVVANSLYNLSLSDDNTTLSIEKKSSSEISESTGADANQAAAISSVIDGADTGNAAFDSVANNINEMLQSGDDAQVKAALDLVTAMSPEAAPMVVSVSTENVAQVFSAIASRLSGGTLASANQGMSSGDSLFEKGAAWVQGLFNHAKLDKTANNDGFKADTAGLALGFEKQVSDETKVGLGYAYNNSDVKSTMRKTDVDTHSVFAYGEYKPSNWFVNGMLSHNWSRYDEKTPVSTAKHDAETLGLQMMTGYNMLMGNVTVTPEAGLRYVHVDQDAYTTSLGANVGGDKSDILTGVIGVNVAKNWNLDNGMTLKPEARLALTYDIKHDATNSTVLLPNGSSYTVVGKALDRFGVEAGLGLTAEINDNVELSVGYEGKFRDDYRDHTGLLNLKYKF